MWKTLITIVPKIIANHQAKKAQRLAQIQRLALLRELENKQFADDLWDVILKESQAMFSSR